MLKLVASKMFRQDAKNVLKTDFRIETLSECVSKIQSEETLDKKYCDHALYGVFEGFRECYVAPKYKLIYSVVDDCVILLRFKDISRKSAT